jgi:hypothetical protein
VLALCSPCARPVLALCSPCARPVLAAPRQILPTPPTPHPLFVADAVAPPRTLFFTRSTHFVKPHTQHTPLPKQNAPPSHYYKNLEKPLSNTTLAYLCCLCVQLLAC